ncbi:carbon storage regulator [Kineobactrum sediminis]|uniref:Translational regulator CsrA n=1 Tax=Kineobactrum sediminis TaxID=1905677 RepID=A0A2N5Y2P6_9GAMM|nr:carbon storage regulator [Kineobactrum sediminis]PLW82656.1 carbon storage regulator [Kineobactrum sediminis]
MLTLTRKAAEAIIINTDQGEIRLVVVAISGNSVKLAIDAPEDVLVLREEVMPEHKRSII